MFFIRLAVFLLISTATAEYTSLEWSYCSPMNHIEIIRNTITPMPIVFPNPFRWNFDADLKRAIDGPIQSKVTMTRTVMGLVLPIRCYLVDGSYTGSCNYNDLCTGIMYILNLNAGNCPESFKRSGIDCTCPFRVSVGRLQLVDDISTYSPVFLGNSWLVKGDYKIRVDASDRWGQFFCLEVRFTLSS